MLLPDKIITELIQYRQVSANSKLCGHYLHVAGLMDLKNNNLLCKGINHYITNRKYPSIHAEIDAISKLRPCKNKIIRLNLVVIRLNPYTSELRNSKCCIECLYYLNKKLQRRGYKIHKLYFSDQNGKIIKSSLSKLVKEHKHICSNTLNSRKHLPSEIIRLLSY